MRVGSHHVTPAADPLNDKQLARIGAPVLGIDHRELPRLEMRSGELVHDRVVERTFAWLSRSRRLARDYERLPERGEAMLHAAMSRIMLRRVAV